MNTPYMALICVIVILSAFFIGAVVAAIPGYWFKKRFFIAGHELLIMNNILGIESIYLDKQKVVSQFSFSGTYLVNIESIEYEVSIFYMWHLLGAGITLKNKSTDELLYTDKWK